MPELIIEPFEFSSRKAAEEFVATIKKMTKMYDVVTVNDVLMTGGKKPYAVAEHGFAGWHLGYAKKDIQKLSIEKPSKGCWKVVLPGPKKIIRGEHEYWTTEDK